MPAVPLSVAGEAPLLVAGLLVLRGQRAVVEEELLCRRDCRDGAGIEGGDEAAAGGVDDISGRVVARKYPVGIDPVGDVLSAATGALHRIRILPVQRAVASDAVHVRARIAHVDT